MEKESIIAPLDEWIEEQSFNSTADIEVPTKMADKVIGQDKAVEVIKKAASQKRHVMLIGEPGTGKSMLANSMVEFLSKQELQDVIAYHNPQDVNVPLVRVLPAGRGKQIVAEQKMYAAAQKAQKGKSMFIVMIAIVALGMVGGFVFAETEGGFNVMFLFVAAFFCLLIYLFNRMPGNRQEIMIVPKLLVGHDDGEMPPFIDATGSHAGSLLGDVRHDPFQSGGLETPSHDRLEPGAVHKASKGVLFIDEINVLRMESQQSLLTAMQEGKLSITGQSERSSGALVKSEPVPCDFILVCAGNIDAMNGMHPALRSRIRGYGYEVYMLNSMKDTDENRKKLIRFIAQEVTKDAKIPHFDKYAVAEILREAQRRAGKKGELTLRMRELGGLVRIAGDVAVAKKAKLVTKADVLEAKKTARSLEQQLADRYIEQHKAYEMFRT
ncbi:MAG: ATP-dependent protease LonB, partial [Methanomassiliicoccaceae archaeon]|nr:ATP-dependent protease LonB [Methanomassiliicoccaceae archaeon]